ncbi:astacin-like metalloprotease toxin 1 [Stegodyphus dumicola]|uniref:astacin-like metalloprotease toxin 1 n=1 Tax=Stegodyphus dumicola TaxID=202533 RepID=UPI0015B0381A|nr:astacin-like metalloprotease toxin 1 [Stegodyphus dumicola]
MQILIILCLVATLWANPVRRHNPMENEGLFEGDIMGIDLDQDRNAVPKDSQRWPNGEIPYLVDEALYPIWETLMLAMRHIEERSCIRFVHKDVQHKNYIKIFKGNG